MEEEDYSYICGESSISTCVSVCQIGDHIVHIVGKILAFKHDFGNMFSLAMRSNGKASYISNQEGVHRGHWNIWTSWHCQLGTCQEVHITVFVHLHTGIRTQLPSICVFHLPCSNRAEQVRWVPVFEDGSTRTGTDRRRGRGAHVARPASLPTATSTDTESSLWVSQVPHSATISFAWS